jgi:hypothetical protein
MTHLSLPFALELRSFRRLGREYTLAHTRSESELALKLLVEGQHSSLLGKAPYEHAMLLQPEWNQSGLQPSFSLQ